MSTSITSMQSIRIRSENPTPSSFEAHLRGELLLEHAVQSPHPVVVASSHPLFNVGKPSACDHVDAVLVLVLQVIQPHVEVLELWVRAQVGDIWPQKRRKKQLLESSTPAFPAPRLSRGAPRPQLSQPTEGLRGTTSEVACTGTSSQLRARCVQALKPPCRTHCKIASYCSECAFATSK